MNPVSNTLSNAASQSRNTTSSAEAGRGAEFANLFSSLAAEKPQPPAAPTPTRAPNKPAQANGKPSANQDQQAVNDPAAEAATQAPQASQASAPAPAKDGDKADAKDEAQATTNKAEAIDPAAQLLAMTQQAQELVQGKAAAGAGETREGISDLPGAARTHAARGLQKPDALSKAASGEEALDPAATHEAKEAGFAERIADVLAARTQKSPQGEDALTQVQSRQDTSATPAAPQALASASAALSTAQTQSAARAANDQLAPRVGAAGWDRALGQKVVWMVGQGEQSASLTLNPPDLGPLQVVLTVSHTQASADFSAAQPEVRQALQDALPRLREMLADAGISLGQANVHAGTGEHAQHAQQGSGAHGGSGSNSRGADNSTTQSGAVESRASVPVRQGLGLVNTFA